MVIVKNIIINNYSKAYKEVYEILKCISEEERKKISPELIHTIEENMDKNYEYHLKEDIEFGEQQMLEETRNILALIYIDYWADIKEKDAIMRKYNHDLQKLEDNKYTYVNIIQKHEKISNEKITLVEKIEEKWYQKLYKNIKESIKRILNL